MCASLIFFFVFQQQLKSQTGTCRSGYTGAACDVSVCEHDCSGHVRIFSFEDSNTRSNYSHDARTITRRSKQNFLFEDPNTDSNARTNRAYAL